MALNCHWLALVLCFIHKYPLDVVIKRTIFPGTTITNRFGKLCCVRRFGEENKMCSNKNDCRYNGYLLIGEQSGEPSADRHDIFVENKIIFLTVRS